jgi:hypothetical protein
MNRPCKRHRRHNVRRDIAAVMHDVDAMNALNDLRLFRRRWPESPSALPYIDGVACFEWCRKCGRVGFELELERVAVFTDDADSSCDGCGLPDDFFNGAATEMWTIVARVAADWPPHVAWW